MALGEKVGGDSSFSEHKGNLIPGGFRHLGFFGVFNDGDADSKKRASYISFLSSFILYFSHYPSYCSAFD